VNAKEGQVRTRIEKVLMKAAGVALASLFFIALVFPRPASALPEGKKVAIIVAMPPEVALLVGFIGGQMVDVRSRFDWASDGTLVVRSGSFPKNAVIIALTPKEMGIPKGGYKVKYLYEFLPCERDEFDKYFFDPASLSFMASRVLAILAEMDPSMYDYFQRRLAEFQSRLDSVVSVGREILQGVPILDLTGRAQLLLKASGATITRPGPELFEMWKRGDGEAELTQLIQGAKLRNCLVVADVWSPRTVREKTLNVSCGVLLPAPKVENMWISYLHDLYLTIWNRFKALGQPKDAQGAFHSISIFPQPCTASPMMLLSSNPASLINFSASFAMEGSTARSSPPDVWGSNNTSRISSSSDSKFAALPASV